MMILTRVLLFPVKLILLSFWHALLSVLGFAITAIIVMAVLYKMGDL